LFQKISLHIAWRLQREDSNRSQMAEAFARIHGAEKVEKIRAVRDLIGSKVKLYSGHWIEHLGSEGGTRSPLRVAKIPKPHLFGIVSHSLITIERFRNRR
jgi:hypothetical protein